MNLFVVLFGRMGIATGEGEREREREREREKEKVNMATLGCYSNQVTLTGRL